MSAIRTLPSVVDDNGGCDFEGPTSDGIGVGSGHMVQYRGRGTWFVVFFVSSFASVFVLLFPGCLE